VFSSPTVIDALVLSEWDAGDSATLNFDSVRMLCAFSLLFLSIVDVDDDVRLDVA
jgi:hypothetical protein